METTYLIDTHTDSNNQTTAIVKCRGYVGTGSSRLHPDDIYSEFFGCRLADIRAQINVLKKIYQDKRQACDECRKFVKSLENYKGWEPNSDDKTMKIVYRQLNQRVKEVNRIADQITALQLEEKSQLKARDLVVHYINKKKSKEDNQSE